jgi:hypothetical protein
VSQRFDSGSVVADFFVVSFFMGFFVTKLDHGPGLEHQRAAFARKRSAGLNTASSFQSVLDTWAI